MLLNSEFRPVTDPRLGDPDFAPDGVADPAFVNGYDILLAAPDNLATFWADCVEQSRFEDADTVLDCHDDAAVIALAHFNKHAAWGNVYSGSPYRTAREQVAALIAAQTNPTPQRRRELARAHADPRGWAEQQRPGRGMPIPTEARGLRCAQLFHMGRDNPDPDTPPGLHTHLLIAPEVVACGGHRFGRAQPGKLYEIDTVTLSSILPSIFTAYEMTVRDLARERLGVELTADDPARLPGSDEPGGPRRGKVDCHPSFRMRQLDQVSGATWHLRVR